MQRLDENGAWPVQVLRQATRRRVTQPVRFAALSRLALPLYDRIAAQRAFDLVTLASTALREHPMRAACPFDALQQCFTAEHLHELRQISAFAGDRLTRSHGPLSVRQLWHALRSQELSDVLRLVELLHAGEAEAADLTALATACAKQRARLLAVVYDLDT